jgi:hypothetical protein
MNKNKKHEKEKKQKYKKTLNNLKKTENWIKILSIVCISGFIFSVVFIIQITGSVIGETRANLWGLVFLILFLLVWAVSSSLRIKLKKQKKINIKELIEKNKY